MTPHISARLVETALEYWMKRVELSAAYHADALIALEDIPFELVSFVAEGRLDVGDAAVDHEIAVCSSGEFAAFGTVYTGVVDCVM